MRKMSIFIGVLLPFIPAIILTTGACSVKEPCNEDDRQFRERISGIWGDRRDGAGNEAMTEQPKHIINPALTGLLVLAVFYTLYFARVFLLPIAAALILYFLLSPVLRSLKKIRVPEFLGSALILLILLGAVSYGVSQLYDPAAEWINGAPKNFRQIERKIRGIRESVEEVKQTAEELERMTKVETKEAKRVPSVEVKKPGFSDIFLVGTQKIIVLGAITLILLYFLLAYGHIFIRKMVDLVQARYKKNRILEMAEEIENNVSRYLFTVTVINTGLGIAIAVAMYLLGMPNPVLWGVMAGLANFVPYIGAIVGVGIVGLVAILSFESIGRALLVPVVYFLITSTEGQIITPMILGRRFALNPIIIYIWLIFWGWMWGIIGALLAIPMLTVFKIFCDHIQPLNRIGAFLGR
jgi:predicted PurR-regulated permease PerM